MNHFEKIKIGLSLDRVTARAAEIAAAGTTEGFDRPLLEQMRLLGIALRPNSPERFAVRVRVPGGRLTAAQTRTLAAITNENGGGSADLTTRAQIQLRNIHVRHIAQVLQRLQTCGLATRQTLMDSVRSIRGCPLAGLAADAIFDATPVLQQLERLILSDEQAINLPKKVNIAITGCRHQCCHAAAQDIALVPAKRDGAVGFNLLIGGKISGMDPRLAVALDVFLRMEEAAPVLQQLVRIYQLHGPRTTRSRARLVHLVDLWGLTRLRNELEHSLARPLPTSGVDLRDETLCRTTGILPQRDHCFIAGLVVPVGRITGNQLAAVADLTEKYGCGELRITGEQNLLIPHIPPTQLDALRAEPLLQQLPLEPHPILAGTQSCTGREFCTMAAIETKQRALDVAEQLSRRLPHNRPLRIHWSACHAGCGQHAIADIGLVGRRVCVDGQMVDAVDIYLGGSETRLAEKVCSQVPCEQLVDKLVDLLS